MEGKQIIKGLSAWKKQALAHGYKVEEVIDGEMWRAINSKTGGLKGTFHTKGTPGSGSLRGNSPPGTPPNSGVLYIKETV